MLPGLLNEPLLIKQGDTFHLEILWQDSEGAPVDTAGCSAHMQLRRTPGEPAQADLASDNGRITLAAGAVTLDMAAADTAALAVPEGVFDLRIEYDDGRVVTILDGLWRLIPAVTRDDNH